MWKVVKRLIKFASRKKKKSGSNGSLMTGMTRKIFQSSAFMNHYELGRTFENITKIVECSICLETVNNPHLVDPCNHVFCGDCIALWEASRINQAECPTCRIQMNSHSKSRILCELAAEVKVIFIGVRLLSFSLSLCRICSYSRTLGTSRSLSNNR